MKLRKASETYVIGTVSKLFGVPTSCRDSLSSVALHLDRMEVLPWLAEDIRLYPWEPDVAASIFTVDKNCPLVQEMVMFAGDVMWVRDSVRKGPDGLWLAFAEDAADSDSNFAHALRGYTPTMIVSHIDVDGDYYRLVAIQAKTLKLK